MIKLILLVIIICAAHFFFPHISISESLADSIIINIITPERLVLSEDDGNGLFFDIARAVYEPAGITVSYSYVPWRRTDEMLMHALADARFGAFRMIDSQILADHPVLIEIVSLISHSDSIHSEYSLSRLHGKKIILMAGYHYEKLDEFHNIQFRLDIVNSQSEAWEMLTRGRAFGFMFSDICLREYVEQNQISFDYEIKEVLSRPCYVEFSDTEKANKLREIFNERIVEIARSGELGQIYDAWAIPDSARPDYNAW